MEFLSLIQNLNILGRFILEVIAVVAIGYWGYQIKAGLFLKLVVGLGASFLVIYIWGIYGAPKSPNVLEGGYKLALEIALFTIGAVALFFSKSKNLAALFTLAAVINTLLLYVWDQ